MVPILFTFFVIGGFAIGATVLAVWLLYKIIGGIIRMIFGGARAVIGPGRRAYPDAYAQPVLCRQMRCGALNPSRARFCRRCGQPLREALVLRAA